MAAALINAVAPLREGGKPVELSLTGGKDSRLVAAALVKAGVPVRAQTHGFADHPDVVIAAEVARVLGIHHDVRVPAAPGQRVDVIGRIRATVLVADGMLSAFENVGRPDPDVAMAVTAGGHGGELLRGGYAEAAAGRRAAGLRAAELLRRLTTRRLGLLRRGAAAGYVASLAPWTGALARDPLRALDDFYLVNRAGRWSAAARQAYLIRECLVQPLFDERVVLAARAVPLATRTSGELSRAVLAELCPPLTGDPARRQGARALRPGLLRLAPPVRRRDRDVPPRLRPRPGRLRRPLRRGEPRRGRKGAHPAAPGPRHGLGPRHPRVPPVRRLPPRPRPRPAPPRGLTPRPLVWTAPLAPHALPKTAAPRARRPQLLAVISVVLITLGDLAAV